MARGKFGYAGVYNSSPITLDDGEGAAIALDANGRIALSSDIEIGAVELKNGADDTRGKIGTLSGLTATDAGLAVASYPIASEVHLGASGGAKTSMIASWTRPADTTAYTANDSVGQILAVSGATNATPIVLTTGTHALADGDPVTVSSVGGNTNANGNFYAKVTGYSTTTFGLYSDKALTTPVAGNSNYTSGGSVAPLIRFTNMARVAGLGGYIVKAQLFTSQKTNTARYRLHVFMAPVAGVLDNVAYATLYANNANRVGVINFPAAYTEDSSTSTQASTMCVPSDGSNLPLMFLTSTEVDLYGILETLDAFTPDNAQTYKIRLGCEVD